MTTGKHGRLIDKTAGLLHDLLVAGAFLWLCLSPTQPVRWLVYVLITCSALLIFRSRFAERTLVHRHPWMMGLLIMVDLVGLVVVFAMAMDHQVLLIVAVMIWISVRALLIPTPAPPRPLGPLPDRMLLEPSEEDRTSGSTGHEKRP
ncbi:MAG TPA: hypothetical protein VJN18_02925 [Polyangiaceae bacterium]|nr:hypothetical protein [Polyangiaceae bacterium]